ncbi:hypothetical protein BVC93_27630 [Mycobacterium sp. MS1601]|uniref:cupin domain-containing protein n=1 Tax=Mycobacterium sp. MS1601 TaxID=1936029 RepID=UPI00097974E5|nr:cupin domain-containing protein [Mycobacterium sp. MS1601]AQA05520.1 hypothetical protein BVC93_27630 [Mycobacterium sp. MS1601]
MTEVAVPVDRSAVDADSYEPFIVDDEAVGEVHWIRRSDIGGNGLTVGLWRAEPMEFAYPFTEDETIHVLEGRVEITLTAGSTIVLEPGDIASFAKGTDSTWKIVTAFKKLFVSIG